MITRECCSERLSSMYRYTHFYFFYCLGNQLKLTASVSGKPEPQIEWYKGDVLLKKSANIDIQKSSSLCNMVIRSASSKDAGVYKCVAHNEAGQCTVEVNIKVDSKASKPKISPNHPKFTFEMENDHAVQEGDEVEMQVKFTGKPRPILTWQKNSCSNVVSIKHVKIQDEDRASQLIIKAT